MNYQLGATNPDNKMSQSQLLKEVMNKNIQYSVTTVEAAKGPGVF